MIHTADTITDAQIRELRDRSRWASDFGDLTYIFCRIALGDFRGDRAKARARCAEILDARAREGK